ncbi:protein mono-ADP-ribosyltransferase PARP12-like [Amia ocellicauda]|uniref:protein mono-ADP-ribosyltransferase PARP12-like n=1 Tax=Amia ocellicauda TaxID=2972642 RepID=UPI003464B136
MEEIEKAYCNPENNTSKGLDFITMKYGSSNVRRLSTASSVTKPPNFVLTTKWVWYWKNEHGKWIEYGHHADKKSGASISSITLEKVYAEGADSKSFSAADQQYVIYFKDMYQQNQKHYTKRDVRRRPRFVSVEEVKKKLETDSEKTSDPASSFPIHWDKGVLPEFGYMRIAVTNTKDEFKTVETAFRKTMNTNQIHKIERIQNPSLWKVFQWQKEQMEKSKEGKEVDERFLFHGTKAELIDPICEQNFDWRICGVNGTSYGKGSYFARDASYSNKYSKVKDGHKYMFFVRVLAGEFTKGHSNIVRPPILYDSCVNSTTDPTIFVIFEKYQIYPEYLIEYS